MAIIFTNLQNTRIKITDEVLNKLLIFKQDSVDKTESGGLLLGREILKTSDIIIDKITTPLKGDKKSRFSFFRSFLQHQKVIIKEWKDSNGTCNYLGEWHTHPEDYPVPSWIDIVTWKYKLKKDKFDSEHLYFIIIGTVSICLWEGNKKKQRIIQLKEL